MRVDIVSIECTMKWYTVTLDLISVSYRLRLSELVNEILNEILR